MKFDSYALKRETITREAPLEYLTEELKDKQEALLKQGVQDNEAFVREFHVETKGKYSDIKLGGLFLFNHEKSEASAVTNVRTSDGLNKIFITIER